MPSVISIQVSNTGQVVVDSGSITTALLTTNLVAAEVTGTSPLADKCLFTTLTPEALRAGVIAQDAAGNHAASFLALEFRRQGR